MKLRLKVLLILTGVWAAISIIIYFYSQSTLTNDYIKLENKEMIKDIEHTRKTLISMISAINLLNNDWAEWDDAYQFMQNKNASFIKSNMAFTTFENAKINLVLFFDRNQNLFYGANYDLKEKKFVPIPQALLAYLQKEKAFLQHANLQSKKISIFKINQGYVVLSSLPILTSSAKGPAAGTLVMGYFFDNHQIEKLSEIVNMQVDFFPLPLATQNKSLNQAYTELLAYPPHYIAIKDSDYISGYTLINDIENNPIGLLRITTERTIYNQGLKTIERYLAIVISIGLIFLISTWYLLKIYILDRVISVNNQITDINMESKFSKRISLSGSDELNSMVSAINLLMEIIELTQEQLKYRIYLRTEELERLSNLNKNLYSEMTKQKEVETQLREGEKVLRHMAYYDVLTGLPNRLFFNNLLKEALLKSKQENTTIALLFIDADKFKSINDTYGHDIGDKFLIHTAEQLRNSLNNTAIVARLAGDEFIVCLMNMKGKDEINQLVSTILKRMSSPLNVNGVEVGSTYSIGIAIFPQDAENTEELEKHADLAMYYAKRQPGNAYCYYNEIKRHLELT